MLVIISNAQYNMSMKNPFSGAVLLIDAVKTRTIADIARELGVEYSAVRQMLNNGRIIYLKKIDGQLQYAELKEFKRGIKKATTV